MLRRARYQLSLLGSGVVTREAANDVTAVSGTLHVNTRDTTELSSFHGRLEATTETGAEFILEF